jgi:hypothetical protein
MGEKLLDWGNVPQWVSAVCAFPFSPAQYTQHGRNTAVRFSFAFCQPSKNPPA